MDKKITIRIKADITKSPGKNVRISFRTGIHKTRKDREQNRRDKYARRLLLSQLKGE